MMKRIGAILILLLAAQSVQAAVVVQGTRVIYPEQEREILVRLNNLSEDEPRVVQVWLDEGDEASSPDTVDVPFVVTPPVFRMEAGGSQALRVSYTGADLPKDRESLYWLNVLEIPPRTVSAEEKNTLHFSYRIRLKTFFRPKGLSVTPDAALKQLQWTLRPTPGQADYTLKVHNPSPYFITLSSIELVDGERKVSNKRGNKATDNMVAPHGTQQFLMPGLTGRPGADARIEFVTVGDYGNRFSSSAPLQPASAD